MFVRVVSRHDPADILRESRLDRRCSYLFRGLVGLETHYQRVTGCFVCGKVPKSAGWRSRDESKFLQAFKGALYNDWFAVGHHRHLGKNHWSGEPTDDFPHGAVKRLRDSLDDLRGFQVQHGVLGTSHRLDIGDQSRQSFERGNAPRSVPLRGLLFIKLNLNLDPLGFKCPRKFLASAVPNGRYACSR